MAYTIKDWAQIFHLKEAARHSEISWTKFPVNRASGKYRRLMATPEGRTAYAVFIGLVRLAARANRGGVVDGTTEDVSFETGIPLADCEAGMALLVSQTIGWVVDDRATPVCKTVLDRPTNGLETAPSSLVLSSSPSSEGMQGEPPPTTLFDPAAGFADFWKLYPSNGRKGDKKDCLRVWAKEKLGLRHAEVVKALKKFIKCPQWKDQDGKFIPAPLVFLNRALYDDPPATVLHPLARRITAEEFRKLDASFGVGPAIEKPTGVPIPQTHTETPPDIGTQQGGSNAK